jgi:hypothetical protein
MDMEPPQIVPQPKPSNAWRLVSRAATVVVVIFAAVLFSGYHARRVCDLLIDGKFAPPYFGTRLVFYPERHIEGAKPGFRPGWVVAYAPESKNYGTAFFVSFLGKSMASGTPSFVKAQKKEAFEDIEKFCQAFAQKDAATKVGNNFSNVASMLGRPWRASTNGDGSFSAYYSYTPPLGGRVPIDWLTNGLMLHVRNNVIVRKGYSYTSVK